MVVVATILFLVSRVCSAPLPQNDVVVVSGPGVSDHGKQNLVCFPTSLMDIAIFVFVNYLTHAASARLPHGASNGRTIKVVIDSLCYPVLGIGYALPAIAQWSVGLQRRFPWIVLPKDNLDTAHRAGALITACRNDSWLPNEKDEGYERVTIVKRAASNLDSSSSSNAEGSPDSNQDKASTAIDKYDCKVDTLTWHGAERRRWMKPKPPNKHFNIFGGRDLPDGYSWVFVPWDAKIEPPKINQPPPLENPLLKRRFSIYGDQDLKLPEIPLGAEYSLFQPIAAVVQAISAGITLYRTRGDQLDRYGFTAFGLTVVPYLVMSVVNFFAHFAVPKYSALYVVQSDILDEATRRQGDDVPRRCVVGRLPSAKTSETKPQIRIRSETYEDGLVSIDIVEPGDAKDKSSTSDKKMSIPLRSKTKLQTAPEGHDSKDQSEAAFDDKPGDKSDPKIVHNVKPVSSEPGSSPEPQPADWVIRVSRFPSVQLRDDDSDEAQSAADDESKSTKPKAKKKKPIGRKTMKALHWLIGLSSLVIIAAISRMKLGTATKPRWKEIFIVWLVFSCLSAVATHMLFGVSRFLLQVCLEVVRRVYRLIYKTFEGFVRVCLEKLKLQAKGKKKMLLDMRENSHDNWWSYVDDVLMFILKFAFFFILLVMVSQQLLDYGDCVYFRT